MQWGTNAMCETDPAAFFSTFDFIHSWYDNGMHPHWYNFSEVVSPVQLECNVHTPAVQWWINSLLLYNSNLENALVQLECNVMHCTYSRCKTGLWRSTAPMQLVRGCTNALQCNESASTSDASTSCCRAAKLSASADLICTDLRFNFLRCCILQRLN